MEWPLVLAGLAMGVAASPHCAVMCGAPCAALTGGCARPATGFHLGRLAGYMAGGAVAAGSVAALGAWSHAAPALRPLWMLLHLGFLALGLWWLAAARQPHWMKRADAVPVRFIGVQGRALRAGAAGLAWVAWPCGALQAALLLAALAHSAQGGALVMAAYAVGSMPALVVGPWAWGRWRAWRGAAAAPAEVGAWGYRLAGIGLVMASGWAVLHGAWERVAAWCAG
jgi:sulfite exporter TauE/SafE